MWSVVETRAERDVHRPLRACAFRGGARRDVIRWHDGRHGGDRERSLLIATATVRAWILPQTDCLGAIVKLVSATTGSRVSVSRRSDDVRSFRRATSNAPPSERPRSSKVARKSGTQLYDVWPPSPPSAEEDLMPAASSRHGTAAGALVPVGTASSFGNEPTARIKCATRR